MTKKNDSKKHNVNVVTKQNKNVTQVNKSITGVTGLINLGNTCYFNSMLQMVLHSPLFLCQLKEYCFSDQKIVAKLECEEYRLTLQHTDVCAVEKELINIWGSDAHIVSPSNLRSALLQHKDFKAHFSGLNEQDSHEVFLMVLNIIKEAEIKRIRASILDYFNCRKNQKVDDDTKKKVKDISTIVEKQNLINNFFGIIIGSTFKCQSCNELRMRFDEVFHISPVFSDKSDMFQDDVEQEEKSEPQPVIVKSHSQINQPEKLSKHQLKRQKRIEKKVTRNKKSVQRNIQLSTEDVVMDEGNGVLNSQQDGKDEDTVNGLQDVKDGETINELKEVKDEDTINCLQEIKDEETVNNVQEVKYEETDNYLQEGKGNESINCLQNGKYEETVNDYKDRIGDEIIKFTEYEAVNLDENLDYPILFGGHNDESSDINFGENIEESFMMQQLLYDTITLDSQLDKYSESLNSSNDSMIVRKNNSSRSSLASLISPPDFEILTENQLCKQFNRNISLEDEYLENEMSGVNVIHNSFLSNTNNTENSDVDNISTKYDTIENEATLNHDMTYNKEESVQDDNSNDVVILQSLNSDTTKVDHNVLFSSTIESYQDHLYSINQHKVAFEPETDLEKALKRFNTPSFLQNIVCENCSKSDLKVKTDHLKTDIICHLPKILPFYISRFKQFTARNRNKNTTTYSYPFILNLSSQCSRYVNISSDKRPVLYRLFGIIEHIGSRINTGHYISYVSRRVTESETSTTCEYSSTYPVNILAELRQKHEESAYNYEWFPEQNSEFASKPEEPSNYQWFRISDSHVEAVSNKSVMNIQAFMLFYSRIQ